MLTDVAIALTAIVAGFLTALWLLLLWVGDAVDLEGERDLDPILGARDPVAIYESQGPYIPMPDHLRTRDEMVDWLTKDLPRLTSEMQNPRT
ncbi:hypothetical protein [Microvirga roseola]|uniref:hypothetical protein n=1 Tax=Microvirga roseola TaxID=2883126 RepID=UPI001E60C980|nr:hypothetical protein [Microvirga roseola]